MDFDLAAPPTLPRWFPSLRHALRAVGRRIRRTVTSKGYSREVFELLRARRAGFIPRSPLGTPAVNLSFDLEFALNGYFWRDQFERAHHFGRLAHHRLLTALSLLEAVQVPANIQIATGLLDPELTHRPFLTPRQRAAITEHPELYEFTQEQRSRLAAAHASGSLVLGIHGHSHREFSRLNSIDAKWELAISIELFRAAFGDSPRFMSYPRNSARFEAFLPHFGIASWRGASQKPSARHVLARGLVLSPGNLSPNDLRRLLRELRVLAPDPFIHLWGHFTEGSLAYLGRCVRIAREEGFTFTAWRGVESASLETGSTTLPDANSQKITALPASPPS